MIHEKQSIVKVVKGVDDTFDNNFLGKEGIVVNHNRNQATGNTPKDPLHAVRFDLNVVPYGHPDYIKDAYCIESFWYEELEPVTENGIKQ